MACVDMPHVMTRELSTIPRQPQRVLEAVPSEHVGSLVSKHLLQFRHELDHPIRRQALGLALRRWQLQAWQWHAAHRTMNRTSATHCRSSSRARAAVQHASHTGLCLCGWRMVRGNETGGAANRTRQHPLTAASKQHTRAGTNSGDRPVHHTVGSDGAYETRKTGQRTAGATNGVVGAGEPQRARNASWPRCTWHDAL